MVPVWHLGVVLIAILLVMAVFIGYSLAPKQGAADRTLLGQQLQQKLARELDQKDLTITKLQTQIASLQAQTALLHAAQNAYGDQADQTTAAARVRSAIPSIESYNADNVPGGANDPDASTSDSGYSGMTIGELRYSYDQSIKADTWVNPSDPGFPPEVSGVTPTPVDYCAVVNVGSWWAWKLDPAGTIQTSLNPSDVCQS